MDSLARKLEEYFIPALALLCFVYLGIELVYIARLPLVMDEFQGASAVYRLTSEIPYADFKPYKTVLGYYLQLPPMLLSSDPWLQMMLVKQAMALVTACSIFFAARKLSKHFSSLSILLATLMLVSMSTFLERSASLRVDMLTSLFGLFGLIYLLDRRLLLAGVLAGVSFLVSQKGIYFILCGGFALGTHWLFQRRYRSEFTDCLRFTCAACAPIALYFLFWAVVTSAGTVAHEVLLRNQHIALTQMYDIRHFWFQTLGRNPFFWALAFLSMGQIVVFRNRDVAEGDSLGGLGISYRDWTLLTYGAALLGLGLWHKQPWPYFFVLLIPTAWILIAAFYDFSIRRWNAFSALALLIVVLLGVVYPARRIPTVLGRDNSLQRSSVSIANEILEEGGSYLAGVSMLHTRRQMPVEFSWLDARRLSRVAARDPREVIERIAADPPKLLITNYRIRNLPGPVLGYLAANYAPYVGNILLYAPTIQAGASEHGVLFAGNYLIACARGTILEIDGRVIEAGQQAWIDSGLHHFESKEACRLQLSPEGIERPTDLRLAMKGILFNDVYLY